MTTPTAPTLTVVVVTRDDYRALRPIVAALAAQTVARQIELIVVAPNEMVRVPPEESRGLHSARVVAVGPVTSRGRAAAHGVLAGAAPIVALTENHCFPEADWAERTLAAHRGGWAAVGPAIENANPETIRSRTLHAFGYGPFSRSRRAGVAAELPLHNSSYRKDLLPPTLAELEELLANEPGLQRYLRERGGELYFDPAPIKWHINESTWGQLITLGYCSGRRYGTSRCRGWPWWKRALYTVATPVLSLPIARNLWSKRAPGPVGLHSAGLVAVMWVCAFLHATGEAVSYAGGVTRSWPNLEAQEFMILERLAGRAVKQPQVATLVALLTERTPLEPALARG